MITSSRIPRLSLRKRVVVIILLLITGIIVGCRTTRNRNFDVRELLISVDDLPEGWKLLSIDNEPIVHFGENDAAHMVFYFQGNPDRTTRGGVTIFQHGSVRDAQRSYARQEQGHFNENSRWATTPFYVPEGVDFSSASADQWRFACHGSTMEGLLEDTVICIYLARYEEFVLFFSIGTEHGGRSILAPGELQSLVETVDQSISSYLRD